MPRLGRFNPHPHTPLTARSAASRVSLERTGDGFAYRIDDDPRRFVRSGQAGFGTCRQLSALVDVRPRTLAEARELARLERELHEDLFALEDAQCHRENARLYGLTG